MILKRAVSRLSIRRCTRVMLDVLLLWSRHHRPTRRCVFFRSYMILYSQRLGGDPKHMSSTQPGGGLNLYKLSLLKLMNLPRSFF